MMKPINIRKIIVPVDFSNSSLNALKMAAAMATEYDAAVHMVHVTDNDYDLFKTEFKLEPLQFAETAKKLGELAKSVIDQHKIKCFYTSEYGAVTHSILKTAISLHADLIIMGKNGSNGPLHDYAGTQACQVAEKSSIPVIIVPENASTYRFENILFPVRPLLSVTDKYEAIRPFLLKNKPALTLLSLRNPANDNELHIIHQLTTLMKTRLEEDQLPYKIEYYFKDNRFAEEILETIKQKAFDLAVITSDAHTSHQDFHLGYYTLKIIHACTIPLLILHAENPEPGTDEILRQLEAESITH